MPPFFQAAAAFNSTLYKVSINAGETNIFVRTDMARFLAWEAAAAFARAAGLDGSDGYVVERAKTRK